ncbi:MULTISPECIES: hypothetical protein [Pedobacter]|uniref:hypothetical protein n=1 Tax=Pedobacter TaxID=84567 RepID=UPI00210EE865|nr:MULTISPECIES: hypothetical protein [unclassified Pedobacter]
MKTSPLYQSVSPFLLLLVPVFIVMILTLVAHNANTVGEIEAAGNKQAVSNNMIVQAGTSAVR